MGDSHTKSHADSHGHGHADGHMASVDWKIGQTLEAWGSQPFRVCAGIGALGLALAFVAGLLQGDSLRHFFFSYLHNVVFCITISLGALFFVLLQFLTRAGWSVVVRRLAEVLANGILPLAVMFVPIVVLVLMESSIPYSWADTAAAKLDPLVVKKMAYLKPGFFGLRCVFYFAFWTLTARFMLRQSTLQDESGDFKLTLKMESIAPVATILFALTTSFAAIDWLMSLDPHWFSTMFGVWFFAGGMVAFFATMNLLVTVLQRNPHLLQPITVEHRHDLTKLMFGFVCFWAYVSFSQYMLIWYANIPEETSWFLRRIQFGWDYLVIALVVGHFIIPFLFLMPRNIKRNKTLVAGASVFLLLMHWIDLYWFIMPEMGAGKEGFSPPVNLIDLGCFVGCVGIYLACLLRLAGNHSLIPLNDPRLPESLAFHNI